MNDQTIVESLWSRSEAAIDMLAEKYGRYSLTIAQRIIGDRADAEECVNDAYLRVWESIPPQKPRSLSAYLGAIVRNLALNRYKHHHAAKREADRVSTALEELQDCLPSSETPAQITEDLVIRDCLNRFLKQLPKREQWVFVRRYWHMDAVRDIAAALKLEENHVYVMLSRSRKQLKAMLEKEGIGL